MLLGWFGLWGWVCLLFFCFFAVVFFWFYDGCVVVVFYVFVGVGEDLFGEGEVGFGELVDEVHEYFYCFSPGLAVFDVFYSKGELSYCFCFL